MIKVINNTPTPAILVEPKWFYFSQNNSGGEFEVNDELTHRVFIEAHSYDEAMEKAEDLGVYLDGVRDGPDCPCCGDRWYAPDQLKFPMSWGKDNQLTSVKEYAQLLANEYGHGCEPEAYLYYVDGRKAAVYQDKE